MKKKKKSKIFYNIIFNNKDDSQNCFNFTYKQMKKYVDIIAWRKKVIVVKCCEVKRDTVLTGKGKREAVNDK